MDDLANIRLRRVASLDDVWDFKAWLGERRAFLGCDVETTGLLVGHDYIRLAQFGDCKMGWAFDYSEWKGAVREAIEAYERPIVAHNLLFDSKMLKADGIVIPQRLAHDSMVMVHLADPKAYMGLKPAAGRYLDKRANAGEELLKKAMAKGGWTWETIPTTVPAYWQYSAFDTCLSALLAEKLYPKVNKNSYEIELAAIHCLRESELAGLRVDEGYRVQAEWHLRQELDALTAQLPIKNPRSNGQVIEYLHSLGARWEVYNEDSGQLSVDKFVLEWLASEHGGGHTQAEVIGEWRRVERLLNSYTLKFADVGKGINYKGKAVGTAIDGVLRASTKPVGARTGRMSITDPPLQTLPRGRVIRDCIIPRDGHCFVMADFAGMELRVLASFAQEPNMLAAFDRGEDLHDFVAKTLYGDNFTKPQRTLCKNGGFANIYGAGVAKFAATAKVSLDEATAFRRMYDETFPGIKGFSETVVGHVIGAAGGKRKGYGSVTLIDGRWLPVEADKAYKGVNFRIQGSCAVVLKNKIRELDHAGLGPNFRLAVHDELLYEVLIEDRHEAVKIIEEVMPDPTSFPGVTLEVESDITHRWGDHYRDDFPKYIDTEDAEWLRTVA